MNEAELKRIAGYCPRAYRLPACPPYAGITHHHVMNRRSIRPFPRYSDPGRFPQLQLLDLTHNRVPDEGSLLALTGLAGLQVLLAGNPLTSSNRANRSVSPPSVGQPLFSRPPWCISLLYNRTPHPMHARPTLVVGACFKRRGSYRPTLILSLSYPPRLLSHLSSGQDVSG